MPEGYDVITAMKQPGNPGLQAAGGVHIIDLDSLSSIGGVE
jgi:hypothetical protein